MIITKRLTLECSGSSNVSSTYLAFSLHTFPTLGDVRLLCCVFVVCTLHFSSPSSSRFPCLSFSRYSKTFQNHHTFLLFFFVLSLSLCAKIKCFLRSWYAPARTILHTNILYITHATTQLTLLTLLHLLLLRSSYLFTDVLLLLRAVRIIRPRYVQCRIDHLRDGLNFRAQLLLNAVKIETILVGD